MDAHAAHGGAHSPSRPALPPALAAVVDTFSLCVFDDPAAALASMAACLRPGGTLLLLEHSRSEWGPLGLYQDLTAPAVAATAKGCRWNDRVPALVRQAGLSIQEVQSHIGGLVVSLVAIKAAGS